MKWSLSFLYTDCFLNATTSFKKLFGTLHPAVLYLIIVKPSVCLDYYARYIFDWTSISFNFSCMFLNPNIFFRLHVMEKAGIRGIMMDAVQVSSVPIFIAFPHIWKFLSLFQASAERATELGAKWFSRLFFVCVFSSFSNNSTGFVLKILKSILISEFLKELMMESLHAFKHTDESVCLRQNCCSKKKWKYI